MVTTVRAVVCLCLWLFVCQIRGSHIPQKMNKTIQSLLHIYALTPEQRFDGKPVFSKELLPGKIESKMVFMGGVLDTYEKLINRMLRQLPTPSPETANSQRLRALAITPRPGTASNAEAGDSVRTDLNYILKRVQELKKNHYVDQEKLLQGLNSLKHIQMDNSVVQSKALGELLWFYDEASSLANIHKMQRRRRRRRHARKVKTHS